MRNTTPGASMRVLAAILLAALTACAATVAVPTSTATAPDETLAPNAALKTDGLPPIPRALAERVNAYTEFRAHALVDWHPSKREMLVRHRGAGSNTVQLYRLREPGGALEQLTNFPEPIRSGAFDPRAGRFIVYPRDAGGNEATQIWRLDLADDGRASADPKPVLLSDPDERSDFIFNRRGDRVLVMSVPLDRTAQGGKREQVGTSLTLVDPLAPEQRRRIAELPGGGWFAFRFAPDDHSLVFIQYKSATESSVWRMDIETGRREQLLPAPGSTRKATYTGFEFTPDGKTLFLATNEGGEFNQLAAYDFASGQLRILSAHIPWDVEDFRISEDGKRLVAIVNADGSNAMHWFDPATGKELAAPATTAMGLGSITGIDWRKTLQGELAFTRSSPQSPGDVYTLNAASGQLTRWTTAAAAVDPSDFATPQIVRWQSFDGRTISGILYLPPTKFAGKRPVLVDIHGGPEGQSTVNFMSRWNYFLNELGVAILAPNVRGSSGYGKTFLELDNGFRREDSVKDIGALLDWLPSHPQLDPKRVMVTGGSYGGYMVLASLTHYSERLRGGIDVVGISNFISFLNNTESYRRDLRRVEYGDERDPAMRAFQERISPLANAARIKVPLFVAHGRNDPRVPYTEAEQIVARVRANDMPVWYLLAENEGHGFARKANVDYYFFAMVRFVETYLLPERP